MNGNWQHVYDVNFPYLLSDVQLIVLCIHRYRKVYFLVYFAGSQNVTPHKLTWIVEQLNLQQSFGGGLDTLVQGIQQILLRYLNAKLIILCTCTANPDYGRLETKLGILHTRSHYPPEDHNTALMLPQNFPSFTKARHSALSLPSYTQSTLRFFNVQFSPTKIVSAFLVYHSAPSIASLQ